MKLFIFTVILSACSSSGMVTETYNESGETIVIVEHSKAELALVEIGKACKERGFTMESRGGSLIMKEGTRIVAKCGKEPTKAKAYVAWW